MPGRGCSFSFVPRNSGTACITWSSMALWRSLTSPRLWWQWLMTRGNVSGTLPQMRHWVVGTCRWQMVRTGNRFNRALWINLYWGKIRKAPVKVKKVESGWREMESIALPWSIERFKACLECLLQYLECQLVLGPGKVLVIGVQDSRVLSQLNGAPPAAQWRGLTELHSADPQHTPPQEVQYY